MWNYIIVELLDNYSPSQLQSKLYKGSASISYPLAWCLVSSTWPIIFLNKKMIGAVKDTKKLKFHLLPLKHCMQIWLQTWQMCSVSSLLVYEITDGHSDLPISFWNGIISSPLNFSLGMGFDAIFIKTSTWKWMSCCEKPL